MRLFAVLLLLAALAGVAHASPKKPVVVSSTTGQFQQLQAPDTLEIPSIAAGSGFACVKVDTSGVMSSGTCGGNPGGSSGQLQYNNSGSFGGFTMAGDCTLTVPNITCTTLNGVSPGYFFSGTDASHLTGTLPSGSCPDPGPSTLGCIESYASVSHQWINAISTLGVPSSTQPAFGDISGTAAVGQGGTGQTSYTDGQLLIGDTSTTGLDKNTLTAGSGVTIVNGHGTITVSATGSGGTVTSLTAGNPGIVLSPSTITTTGTISLGNPSASTIGGVESFASVSHEFLTQISTLGVVSAAQPAFTDLSGSAGAAQLATNLSAAIDSAFGSAQGDLLCRGASTWGVIAAGTLNYALVSGGTSVCPSWALPPVGGNPIVIGPAQIGVGNGAPPISMFCPNSAGESSLCMRDDTGILYTMWDPPTAVPTVVQSQAAVNTYTATMSSTPTVGNYLIALCYNMSPSAVVPTLSAGWTSITTHLGTAGSNFEGSAVVAYQLIAPGTPSGQTPCSSSPGSGNGINVVEVSGLDGVNFANSLQSTGFATATANAAATATVSTTSTVANSFGLSLPWGGGYSLGSFIGGITNPTFNSGWTLGAVANAGFTGGSSATISATELFPSNGSSISAQASATSGGHDTRISNILLVLQPSSNGQTTGFQPVSYLTTIENAGTTISSNARSINCSTGSSCSTDAMGNITLTASGTGVTSVATSGLLTGGPITATGTISISSIAADAIVGNFTGSSASPISQTIPNCVDTGGQHLNYSTLSHTLSCGSSGGGGGSGLNNPMAVITAMQTFQGL